MVFGNQPDLYIIVDYINSSLLKETFKTTDVYKNNIINQTFLREITGGIINVDVSSNTYTFADLTWLFTSKHNDHVQIETSISGTVTLNEKDEIFSLEITFLFESNVNVYVS